MSHRKSAKPAAETCTECGGHVSRTRENHRLPLGGGWGITLEGVEIIHCASCGERGISIERLGPLMDGVAAAVVRKRGRLAAPEVTFLRKHIGYTGARLAKALGVTGPTVSRWETGKEPIGPSADRLLRALVLRVDRRRCGPLAPHPAPGRQGQLASGCVDGPRRA
jgi:putative zinc finger/helix-turn-helix YgiT family protein